MMPEKKSQGHGQLLIAPEGIEIYVDQRKKRGKTTTLNRTRRN